MSKFTSFQCDMAWQYVLETSTYPVAGPDARLQPETVLSGQSVRIAVSNCKFTPQWFFFFFKFVTISQILSSWKAPGANFPKAPETALAHTGLVICWLTWWLHYWLFIQTAHANWALPNNSATIYVYRSRHLLSPQDITQPITRVTVAVMHLVIQSCRQFFPQGIGHFMALGLCFHV